MYYIINTMTSVSVYKSKSLKDVINHIKNFYNNANNYRIYKNNRCIK